MKNFYHIFLIYLLILYPKLEGLVCTSLTGTQDWNNASTWTSAGNCNQVPTSIDDVIIPNGSEVTLDSTTTVESLLVENGGTLLLTAATTAMPNVTGNLIFEEQSTVAYAGDNNQNVVATTYGNLILTRTAGTRTRTALAGNFLIKGDFTIDSRTTWTGVANSPSVVFEGNITRLGTFTSGSGIYTFSGSSSQTITGTLTITNAVLDNSSSEGLVLLATHTYTNFTINPNAVLTLSGTTTAFPTTTTRSIHSTSTVRFVGSGTQSIAAHTYGNLLVGNAGSKRPLAGTLTVAGNLTVEPSATFSGNTNNPTIDISGNVTITGIMNTGTNPCTIGGNLSVEGTGTLQLPRIVGGNAMPNVAGTISFNPSSTVSYNGAGAQTIIAMDYGNLTVTGSGDKTPEAGLFNILGNLSIAAGTWQGGTNNPAVNIAGNYTRGGTFNSGSGLYDFNGSSLQTMNSTGNWINLRISNTNGVTTVARTITNLEIMNGALYSTNGSLTLTNLTMEENSSLEMGGTTSALTVSGTNLLDATSTINIIGSGNQTFPPLTYGNLVLGNAGNKTAGTAAAQTINIQGDLTLNAGTYVGTTRNPAVNLAGNLNINSTFNSGTGVFTFNGNTTQTINGAITISNLNINNSASTSSRYIEINNDLSVVTNLTFTSGRIVTNSNKVILLNTSTTTTGADVSTGWVAGNLQLNIPAGSSTTLAGVGTNGASAPVLFYSPVELNFIGVGAGGGRLIVSANLGDHPEIASANDLLAGKSLNRWWRLTTTGVTGTALPAFTSLGAIFSFTLDDLDAGVIPNNLEGERWNGSNWTQQTSGSKTSNSIQLVNLSSLGEFAFAETSLSSLSLNVTMSSLIISDPINGATNPKAIPGSVREFTLLITNEGRPGIDNNSVYIISAINPNSKLFVGDVAGSGSGPVAFTQGSPTSSLSYSFISLNSSTDDLEFSDDNGITWNYTPIADSDDCDENITHIRVNPKGSMSSVADAQFTLKYRSLLL